MPFAGIYPSSTNHADRAPRWRLVLFLSRRVTKAAEFNRVWRGVKERLGFEVGQEAKDASRQNFVWAEPSHARYVFGELSGAPVDVDAILEATPEDESDGAAPIPIGGEFPAFVTDANLEAAAALLAPKFVKGERHRMSKAIAGACAWSGVRSDDAFRFLCRVAALGPCGNVEPSKRRADIERTYERAATGAPVAGWPRLRELAGAELADQVRDVLLGFPSRFVEALGKVATPANDTAEPDLAATKPAQTSLLPFEFGGLEGEPEPVDYLVDSILPAKSVAMFVAEPFALKSWAAFDSAIAVAHGRPWLGKYATKPGCRTFIIDYEMGKKRVRVRMRQLGDDGRVGRLSHPEAMLDERRFWDELEKFVQSGEGPCLFVVDSLSAGNPNAEEKDPRFANPLKVAASFADKFDSTFVFVHHTTKDQSGGKKRSVRGSGAISPRSTCASSSSRSPGRSTPMWSASRCARVSNRPSSRLDSRPNVGLNSWARETPHGLYGGGNLYEAIRTYIVLEGPDVPDAIAATVGKRKAFVRDACKVMVERGELVIINRKHISTGRRSAWRASTPRLSEPPRVRFVGRASARRPSSRRRRTWTPTT